MIARTTLFASLALALGPLTPAQEEAPPPSHLDGVPALVELGGEVAHVPFTLGGGRPVPLVEAMVNGRGPFKFFYDTGASVCVLDTGFVEELGLSSLGTTEVGDHTANARISAPPRA